MTETTSAFELATTLGAQRATPNLLPRNATPAQIRRTSEDFEAVFLSQMVSHMFEGIDVDPTFGGGHGESVFRTMQINEFGKAMAKAGGLGIAKQLEREMLKLQEVRS